MSVLDKWAERIYSETDVGRSVATSIAGLTGLATYLATTDWVISAYCSIIVFPVVRLMSASFHRRLQAAAERHQRELELERVFDSLSVDEKAVVEAFVVSGSAVMLWRDANESDISALAIESLIQRKLASTSMTADGLRETFVLSTQLFNVGLKKLDASSCTRTKLR